KRISHAESPLVVAHPFSPTTRKAVELFQFLRNKPTKFAAPCFDHVLEARRGRTTFSRKNRARWSIKWVREWQRALCVEVSRSGAFVSTLLVLCALQILPRTETVSIQKILGRNVTWISLAGDISQSLAPRRRDSFNCGGPNQTVRHEPS